LLALTVRRWFGPGIALLAAGLYALDPYSKRYVSLVLTETLTGFLVLAATYAFTRAWQERATRWWLAAGALAGASTLTRPVFALAVPLLALAALVRGVGVRERALPAAGAAAAALVLLAPWLWHQEATIGSLRLASFGEGLNLLLAAHGEGLGHSEFAVRHETAFAADFSTPHGLAPTPAAIEHDPEAHARYVARADETYRDEAWSLLRHRLADDPGAVLWETLYRAYFGWMAHEDWFQPHGLALLGLRLLDWAALALGALGALVALRVGGAARAVVVFLLAYTLVLGTHHVEARFTIPVRGLLLAFAAVALARLWHGAPSRSTAESLGRWHQAMQGRRERPYQ
jgi:hypothetical protein